jgi:hypothetical protein
MNANNIIPEVKRAKGGIPYISIRDTKSNIQIAFGEPDPYPMLVYNNLLFTADKDDKIWISWNSLVDFVNGINNESDEA